MPGGASGAVSIDAAACEPEPAGTPVKAEQADLDKLLGSRLKSVKKQANLHQAPEAAMSPVAALRSQLRRVKLEPEDASSPPTPFGGREGVSTPLAQVRCSPY